MGTYDVNVTSFRTNGFVLMYMVYNTSPFSSARDAVSVRPTAPFDKFVKDTVSNYLLNNIEPPQEIIVAIRNLADDVISGKNVVMRSGDYICLVNYAKKTGNF